MQRVHVHHTIRLKLIAKLTAACHKVVISEQQCPTELIKGIVPRMIQVAIIYQ